MEDQINQIVQLWQALVGDPDRKTLKKEQTPFHNANVKGGIAAPVSTGP